MSSPTSARPGSPLAAAEPAVTPRRPPRAHISLVLAGVLIVIVGLFFIFNARLSVDTSQRRAEAGRLQALWLARSAVTAGLVGQAKVTTPYGEATVQVVRAPAEVRATVELPRVGRAEVQASTRGAPVAQWQERFERAPKAPRLESQ